MTSPRIVRIGSLTWLLLCLSAIVASAGPHLKSRKFGKTIVGTFWGKVMLLSITGLAIPLLLYTFFRPKLKELSTLKVLRKMARINPDFHWPTLEKHFTEVFTKIHQGWNGENLGAAVQLCTVDYWQNQQSVNFDRWKGEGLKKHSQIEKINHVAPILVRYSEGSHAENASLVINFKAKVEDYFENQTTKEIVECPKAFKTWKPFGHSNW